MKKLFRRLLSVALVAMMVAALTATPAFAAGLIYEKTQTVYMQSNGDYCYATVSIGSIPSASKKISNVKSSNKAVAAIESIQDYSSTDHSDYYSGTKIIDTYNSTNHSASIGLRLNKAGTTNITFKYNSKTYTIKVIVKKYVNPVASLKVTGVNSGKELKSLTAKYVQCLGKCKLTKTTKNVKVTVKAATGWKIQSLSYNNYYFGCNGISSYTLNVGTVKANAEGYLNITFVNTSNNATIDAFYQING